MHDFAASSACCAASSAKTSAIRPAAAVPAAAAAHAAAVVQSSVGNVLFAAALCFLPMSYSESASADSSVAPVQSMSVSIPPFSGGSGAILPNPRRAVTGAFAVFPRGGSCAEGAVLR